MNASRLGEPATVGVVPTLPCTAGRGWAPAGGVEAWPVATAPRPCPRLTWALPRWQPPSGNGLVAVVPAGDATRGWVECLLAIDGANQVVWAGLGDQCEREALGLVGEFMLPAATLVHAGTDARQAWVALQVAGWLSHQRAAGGLRRPCLTAWATPTPPTGAARIPHLVSISHTAATCDAVVWELADVATAQELAGLPADWEFFDLHVPALLELRTALRSGRLPETPLAHRALELTWARGQELSIELVYRNADLFRVLVEAWQPPPSMTDGEHR